MNFQNVSNRATPGRMPIWVERSREVSDEEVLEFVNENYVDDEAKQSFTVIHDYDYPTPEAEKWCSEHQWRYLKWSEIYGSEDQGVILLDVMLFPEQISRGRNLLVIVTTRRKHE